ncbi:MAG: Rrf2 family transcriptional regulator [Chitinophagaceae bacterium]
MFSKTCEYAIRAMIYIAGISKRGAKVSIKEIAREIDAPEQFIAKILQELCKNGLLLSQKGPTGGFYLDKNSLQRSSADIVKLIDGDKLYTGCALGLPVCSEKKPCPLHNQFKKVRKDIYTMLKNAKIGKMQEQLENNRAYLKRP